MNDMKVTCSKELPHAQCHGVGGDTMGMWMVNDPVRSENGVLGLSQV